MISLQKRPLLAKIIKNFGWQSFDKIFRIGMAVIVSVLIIRYLGPDRFGAYSYALAFAGVFMTVAGLGLDGIVVRELARGALPKETVLGTVFLMKLASGTVSFLVMLLAIARLKTEEPLTVMMTGIFAAGAIFIALDVVDFWFQSQIKAKFTALARGAAFTLSSLLKIVLVLRGASLLALSLATVGETALAAAALALTYRLTGGRIKNWRWNPALAKTLVSESWPLIISGFAVIIYMRIDQVMLGSLLDNQAVGLYAAAVKFSEVWYFIPGALFVSVLPAMVSYFETDRDAFFRKYQNILNVMVGASLAIALVMTFVSKRLAVVVYGKDFAGSGPILAVHIWAGVFVFLGYGGSIFTMVNGYQKFAMLAALTGLVTKVGLNLLVIPARGVLGAAWTMVIAQAVASYLIYLSSPRTRPVFWMMTRALARPWKFAATAPAGRLP